MNGRQAKRLRVAFDAGDSKVLQLLFGQMISGTNADNMIDLVLQHVDPVSIYNLARVENSAIKRWFIKNQVWKKLFVLNLDLTY